MAPSPQCSAVSSAMQRQGLSYSQLASKVGTSEARVQEICTGTVHPTQNEFNSLAQALGISNPVSTIDFDVMILPVADKITFLAFQLFTLHHLSTYILGTVH
ncbi:hypothetical protein HYDPIDRAFT_94848 [Hydnomerulius pinastri MD-312]|uniref:Unplaced genomic scaffold scaffold_22, whole genome shotgun sequence n=1 Tax=Hydnomerulius pinastri MD-312 TaxID=994086 RepID=A0A0C9WD97_9AGAM|nr:hypothetical protein HYDPIDRAFT_94848 [Hydnomerulius pinastri MD-312]